MTTGRPPVVTVHGTAISGCVELRMRPLYDSRGHFLKTYHEGAFQSLGLCTRWREEFITSSARGVIRGMHFQLPPEQHIKLVICLTGRVVDVALDLRVDSPTYGRCTSVELSRDRANALYIPEGFAHGFQALEDGSSLLYKVSSMHSPAHDMGLRWDSIDFDWPLSPSIVSTRDASFDGLRDFQSPFRSRTNRDV